MIVNSKLIKRCLGYGVIAAIWGALLAVLAFFAVVFALYRDLKQPATSHLTAHGPLGFQWMAVYERNFMPLWSGDPQATQYDPALIYVPKPGVSYLHAPEFNPTITIAPLGVRQQQTDPNTANDLIVMAGDSFTLGFGVEDNQTFSSLLEQRYHFQTVNTGVASYGTAREMYWVHRLGLMKKASMLVIQYCANDGPENMAYLEAPETFFVKRDTHAIWEQLGRYRQKPVTYLTVLAATVRYVWGRVTADSLRSYWRELKTEHEPHMRRYPPSAPEAAANFLAILDRYPELAGKPIIVTEMNLFHYDSTFLQELARLTRNRPNFRVVSIDFPRDQIFRLDGHINALGHAAAAAKLAGAIQELRTSLAGRK